MTAEEEKRIRFDAQFLDESYVSKDRRILLAEIDRLRTMSTVQMMGENENVRQHVVEWERRCLKAEAEIDRLRADRDQWKASAEGVAQHHSEHSNFQDQRIDKLEATNRRLQEELDRFKDATEIAAPDYTNVPLHELQPVYMKWLEGKVKQLQAREQMVHEQGRQYAEAKLENRRLREALETIDALDDRYAGVSIAKRVAKEALAPKEGS